MIARESGRDLLQSNRRELSGNALYLDCCGGYTVAHIRQNLQVCEFMVYN